MAELVGLIWGGPGAETEGDTRTESQEGLRKGGMGQWARPGWVHRDKNYRLAWGVAMGTSGTRLAAFLTPLCSVFSCHFLVVKGTD